MGSVVLLWVGIYGSTMQEEQGRLEDGSCSVKPHWVTPWQEINSANFNSAEHELDLQEEHSLEIGRKQPNLDGLKAKWFELGVPLGQDWCWHLRAGLVSSRTSAGARVETHPMVIISLWNYIFLQIPQILQCLCRGSAAQRCTLTCCFGCAQRVLDATGAVKSPCLLSLGDT